MRTHCAWVPNPAAEYGSATGDVGVHVSAVLRLLVALKGLRHEPVATASP